MSAGGVTRERIEAAMREALDLAALGVGDVEPNPPVGAVVLDAAGRVVGRGRHEVYGGPHAEPHALRDAGERARGGTLVVTLEPCSHVAKKTPPCVDAVLASGVSRVVAGCEDPNPATRGRAETALRAAGVDVELGVLRRRCEARVARFARHLERELPWTIAKWAMSADGHVADAQGGARWITGPAARELVHELRGCVEAVVVGVGTVVADDPLLTCRSTGHQPRAKALRVVLDSRLRIPTSVRLVTGAGDVPTLVVCTDRAPDDRRRALEERGVRVVTVSATPEGRVDVVRAWRALHAEGVRRVLLESGGALTGAALRAGVVQRIAAFVAPVVVGGAGAPSPFEGVGWSIGEAPRLVEPRVRTVGQDALLEGFWPDAPGP